MSSGVLQTKAMAAALRGDSKAGLSPVATDEIYPLEVFKYRTGLESASLREMRRKGFIIRRIGRRSFVRGSDFLNWFDNAPQVIT